VVINTQPIVHILAAILIAVSIPGFSANAERPKPVDVLTAEEAAEMLRVEPVDLLRMAEAAEIPARKLGKQWRFNRTAVMAWLAGKDPVGATVLAQETHSVVIDEQNLAPQLNAAEMSKTVARGVEAQQSGVGSSPDTIGEKPQSKTAEEVFLRDQAILLNPRSLSENASRKRTAYQGL
jgi:excisionase family DNA binding protein